MDMNKQLLPITDCHTARRFLKQHVRSQSQVKFCIKLILAVYEFLQRHMYLVRVLLPWRRHSRLAIQKVLTFFIDNAQNFPQTNGWPRLGRMQKEDPHVLRKPDMSSWCSKHSQAPLWREIQPANSIQLFTIWNLPNSNANLSELICSADDSSMFNLICKK